MRISIITPVLNKARYIERCFESVARQSYSDLEHVIIDGGSDDGTVKLIEKYESSRANVTCISEPDRGHSHAMNRGMRLGRGDIMGFLHADDYEAPDSCTMVSVLLIQLETPAI